jgi:hypothetical protein
VYKIDALKTKMAEQGLKPVANTPAGFAAQMESELKLYGDIFSANIRVECEPADQVGRVRFRQLCSRPWREGRIVKQQTGLGACTSTVVQRAFRRDGRGTGTR